MTFRPTPSVLLTTILSVAPFCGATDRVVSDSIPSSSPSTAVAKEWAMGDMLLSTRQEMTGRNPAAKPYLLPFSVTSLAIEGVVSNTASTLPAETGTGELTGNVAASSYRHIGENTTVWGHARFQAGTIKDVVWNNSADYDLVGPYVIGDPVGGDLTRRSYDFGGGYAGTDGAWTWGVEATYRASIDYRGRDPRDKIIVSDLDASVGGSCRPSDWPLAIAVSGDIRVYNQNASIEFYSPVNDIPTYAMTGLGSYYPRFSGNSGRNTAYSGIGFGATASIFPTATDTSRPVWAEVEFSHIGLRQYLRDFNNLELTHTATLGLGAETGMLFGNMKETAGGISYGFILHGDYRLKTGTENLLGSSTGNNYPKIGERDNYRRKMLDVRLSLPAEKRFGLDDRLKITLSGSFNFVSEKLTEPLRQASASSVTPSLTAEWGHRFACGSTLVISGELSRRFTSPGTVILTGLEPDTPLAAAVIRDIALMTSDVTACGLSVRMDFPIAESASLFIKAGWRRLDLSRRCGSADYFSVSAGISL